MTSSTAGPGWFPDPGDPSLLRYWDGSSWTEHTAPRPPTASPPPAGGYASSVAPAGATDGMAVASLVLSLLWIFWIGSVLAVIFGHVSLGRIARSGGTLGGRGLAIAGLVIGYVAIGFFVLSFILGLIGSAAST